MEMCYRGMRTLDFVSADGTKIKGIQLFVSYLAENVVGEMTDKIFLNDGFALPEMKPGQFIEVSFNNKGKAESITLSK